MSLHHSAETHQSLLGRIPQATGRDVDTWLQALDDGPGLVRFEERVQWLRGEHSLPQGYARALVHEHDRRRAAARS
jgi:hypothetical protein